MPTGTSNTTLGINIYGPWGEGGSGNLGRFQYKGMPFIGTAGLYHDRARAYIPSLGRFAQSDPIGYGDGMNFYAFAHNDPINGADPTGLDSYCTTEVSPPSSDYYIGPDGVPVVVVGGTTTRVQCYSSPANIPGAVGSDITVIGHRNKNGGQPQNRGHALQQPVNPQLSACLQAAFKNNIGSLGLDAAGLIVSGVTAPESLAAAGAGLALTSASLVNSAVQGDRTAIGIGAVGYHLTALTPISAGSAGWARFIPGVGVIVSGIALVHDFQTFDAVANACYASSK